MSPSLNNLPWINLRPKDVPADGAREDFAFILVSVNDGTDEVTVLRAQKESRDPAAKYVLLEALRKEIFELGLEVGVGLEIQETGGLSFFPDSFYPAGREFEILVPGGARVAGNPKHTLIKRIVEAAFPGYNFEHYQSRGD